MGEAVFLEHFSVFCGSLTTLTSRPHFSSGYNNIFLLLWSRHNTGVMWRLSRETALSGLLQEGTDKADRCSRKTKSIMANTIEMNISGTEIFINASLHA